MRPNHGHLNPRRFARGHNASGDMSVAWRPTFCNERDAADERDAQPAVSQRHAQVDRCGVLPGEGVSLRDVLDLARANPAERVLTNRLTAATWNLLGCGVKKLGSTARPERCSGRGGRLG